jgi:hypothetical protein
MMFRRGMRVACVVIRAIAALCICLRSQKKRQTKCQCTDLLGDCRLHEFILY